MGSLLMSVSDAWGALTPTVKRLICVGFPLLIVGLLWSHGCYAAGTDYLIDSSSDVDATIGSGSSLTHYILLLEVASCLWVYHKTKSPGAVIGYVGILIFAHWAYNHTHV